MACRSSSHEEVNSGQRLPEDVGSEHVSQDHGIVVADARDLTLRRNVPQLCLLEVTNLMPGGALRDRSHTEDSLERRLAIVRER